MNVKKLLLTNLPVGQFICQGVKLPARRGFSVCRIPKEELIHGDMIAGHELKKDLEARMLPLVFNIGEGSQSEVSRSIVRKAKGDDGTCR